MVVYSMMCTCIYIHTCTEGTCTSAMYGNAQCDVYTYIHVLKVYVHRQCMVMYSLMHIHIHIYTCTKGTCISTMYGSVQYDVYMYIGNVW